MIQFAKASATRALPVHGIEPSQPPAWVGTLSHLNAPVISTDRGGLQIGTSCGGDFCRVTARVEHAIGLTPANFEAATQSAYAGVFQLLGSEYSPVRFWNFLPRIHDPMDDSQNRYMTFNAGRYQAFQIQYGQCETFDQTVATASAVGHEQDDLWIHCFASRAPSRHLSNPRQLSPHRYSARFGRLPPCFARATFLEEKSLLLVGGTASILGEASQHTDLPGQLDETLKNLSAVIQHPLDRIVDAQVYYPRATDRRWLLQQLNQRLNPAASITLLHADLCRPELLVEIEAVAHLSPDELS